MRVLSKQILQTAVIFGLSSIVISLLIVVPPAQGAVLTRNLSLGDQGDDVIMLQQLLNTNPATGIAIIGPGSPGHETPYFGSLTEDAVKRYQALYASEILYPLGLTAPTGIVGSVTRAHMATHVNAESSFSTASENFSQSFTSTGTSGQTPNTANTGESKSLSNTSSGFSFGGGGGGGLGNISKCGPSPDNPIPPSIAELLTGCFDPFDLLPDIKNPIRELLKKPTKNLQEKIDDIIKDKLLKKFLDICGQ